MTWFSLIITNVNYHIYYYMSCCVGTSEHILKINLVLIIMYQSNQIVYSKVKVITNFSLIVFIYCLTNQDKI